MRTAIPGLDVEGNANDKKRKDRSGWMRSGRQAIPAFTQNAINPKCSNFMKRIA